jgi:hypothetical protein
MVKRKTVQGLLVLAVLFWSTRGAQARDIFKDIQADVFALGGGSTLVDAQDFDSAGRLMHTRFEVGSKWSVGVAVPYGKLLNLETAFTTGPNNLWLTNTEIFPHTQAAGSVVEYPAKFSSGSESAVFHAPFSFRHFRPYAEGGVEFDHYTPSREAIATARYEGWATVNTALLTHNDKFGMNVGVGIDRKFTKRFTFRIDVRDHITSSPAFGLPRVETEDSIAVYPVSGRANNLVYMAGILFHLGK